MKARFAALTAIAALCGCEAEPEVGQENFSCAPERPLPEPIGATVEERRERFEIDASLRMSAEAENCLSRVMNGFGRSETVPTVDALMGACAVEVDQAAALAHTRYWASNQYEPTVAEQIASEERERQRLREVASYVVTLHGEVCRFARPDILVVSDDQDGRAY